MLNIPNISTLRSQKPNDIETFTVEQLQTKYSSNDKRKYISTIEILTYWTDEFNLAWDSPMCFACRGVNLAINLKQLGEMEEENEYSATKLCNVWHKYLERAHIISARHGGPFQPWNVVYLCPECHAAFDETFSGYPKEYDDSIQWIKNRANILREYMLNIIEHHWINNNKIILDVSKEDEYFKILNSPSARDRKYNKYILSKKPGIAEKMIALINYTIDKITEKQ